MKNLLLVFLCSTFLISCNSGLEGEGAATAQKEFAIETFTNLEANCNCDITLIPAPTPKVVVESHQNLVDNVEITSSGKNLVINEKSNVESYDLYHVIVYFTPDLNQIELNKQAKMKVSGTLKANSFQFELNDQAAINETFVELTDLELQLADQSLANFTGTVINVDLKSSDNSRAELTGMQAVEINFNAADNSTLSVYALKDLLGKATENAQVFYKGDPKKDTTEKDKAKIQQQ